MPEYAELHSHSNYSFQEGASFIHEMSVTAKALNYSALALTDHDNLCGAMEFARTAKSLNLRAIIGAEVTLQGGHHLTLLAETQRGYNNLCRLLSSSHIENPRLEPALSFDVLTQHTEGIVALSGCRQGELSSLIATGRNEEAERVAGRYLDCFGPAHFLLELQQNFVHGDRARIRGLLALGERLGIEAVATNNAHYHIPDRHRLQDALVAIKACKSLEESHRELRPNAEFYLKTPEQMAALFSEVPPALSNTLAVAERCTFDLTRDLNYRFPEHPVPPGFTPDSYLEHICREAAKRRYGFVNRRIEERLEQEFRLISKHGLAGFLLIYHDIIQLALEVMIDLGRCRPGTPLEEALPGRGRGSSVAMLVGYLIGLSHIDPLQYNLSLERFLPDEGFVSVPDIDLDFPRDIREELIRRVHEKWGWQHAALTGMIDTYRVKGAVRDLGKVLALPPQEIDQLAKRVDNISTRDLRQELLTQPDFRMKVDAPGWRELLSLAKELEGFPRHLAQHPGGMIISSTPLNELVPIQRGAIEGRFVCQWDKDAIDDAGFVKIDFLGLGALSQFQDALDAIEVRHGKRIDLTRVDFADRYVYEMIHRADTIGIFQIESSAQMQTVVRLKPQDLTDMAHEVGCVRPGVGVNDGVTQYINRRLGKTPVVYDHPLERPALERTLGIILFQDQVNQVAMHVAGLSAMEADELRRAFSRKHNEQLIQQWWQRFRDGAAAKGVDEKTAEKIYRKFTGQYMFPEAHAFAFGVTAYHAAWLKRYYPLEFYLGLFRQQPMGFYNTESLKEDAKHHEVGVLNPDINFSSEVCTAEGEAIRLGFLTVKDVGEVVAKKIVAARGERPFASVANFMERTGLIQRSLENLVEAGAFDALQPDRRTVFQEVGLRYRPVQGQLALSLPVQQDFLDVPSQTDWERMEGEYRTMGLFPTGHVMEHMRQYLGEEVVPSNMLDAFPDGAKLTVAGLVIRRQHPAANAIFITLEDEYGLIPLILWMPVYERYKVRIREPFLIINGQVTRRDGTFNVIVEEVKALKGSTHPPKAKDFR